VWHLHATTAYAGTSASAYASTNPSAYTSTDASTNVCAYAVNNDVRR
jgi:hypothetical protein